MAEDVRHRLERDLEDAHALLVDAANAFMLSESLLAEAESESASLKRVVARERMVITGLGNAAALKALDGNLDEANAMLDNCRSMYEMLSAYAEHKGYRFVPPKSVG